LQGIGRIAMNTISYSPLLHANFFKDRVSQNRGDEPIQVIMHVYMEMSKLKSLYSYLIQTKMSIFALVILEMGFVNYFPGVASNHDPPDLRLPNTKDYRYEPPVPSLLF
jgi:hypothetical protein